MCLLAWFRALGHKQAPASRKKKKQQQHQTNKSKSEPVVVYAISEGVTKMGVSSTECAIRGSSAGAGVLGPAPGSAKLQHHPCGHCCAAANMLVQNAPQQQQQQNQNHQSHHGHQHQHQHQHHHHHHGHHQQQQAQHHSHHQQPQPQQQMGKHHHHHHHHHHVQEVLVTPHHNNNNNNGTSSETHIFAPLKSKMKVLKKIKKKMGLAPRSSNAGTNNLPPLTFHQVHGDNIRLCNGNTIAKRQESFCKGVTFSARPVRVGEKVCVKFLEISDNWSGVIRFGFTSNDPSNLRSGLPRYACPDLTNKPGYWAKALAERFAEPDTVLFYYVTSAGDVHFGVNGEEKGVFFSGVETRSPLWAIIDVYGNSTAIEFVDPNRQHFNNNNNNNNNNSSNNNSGNNARRSAEHASNEDNAQHTRHSAMEDASNAGRDLERIIVPSLQSVSIHQEPDVELPGLRFQPQGMLFSPLPFHSTRGRNIRFSNQQCVASRSDTEFCHGYAFTNRPLLLGERIVVQILATEPMYVGALALGLTSCDPSRLGVEDLPDDSDLLLDRPEYWVVSKDVASSPQPGDEIAFTVSHFGEVQMSKNGGSPSVVMHVDQSLQLWAFVDVYGSTQRVRMLASRPPCSPPRQQRQLPAASPAPTPAPAPAPVLVPAPELSRISEMVQFKPALGGGTVLVVNLPPQAPYPAPPGQPTTTPSTQQQQAQPIYGQTAAHRPRQALAGSSPPNFTATMASTGSSTYVEPVSYQSQPATSQQQSAESSGSSSAAAAASHLQQWREGLQPPGPGQPSECSICYERNIDSVLYMCGHMCMCYTCAVQQWRGKGGGHCPLCRATIRDVIRIYRS